MFDNIKMRLALIWVALTKKYFFVTATSTFIIGKNKFCYERLPVETFKRNVFLKATSEMALKLRKDCNKEINLISTVPIKVGELIDFLSKHDKNKIIQIESSSGEYQPESLHRLTETKTSILLES